MKAKSIFLIWYTVFYCFSTYSKPLHAVKVYYTQNNLEKNVPAQPVKNYTPTSDTNQPAVGCITINTTQRFQTMAGIGAAFSEIGTLAFTSLPAKAQNAIVKNLFDIKNGAGFSFCRLPVGSSDFATSAYSYAETAEDYQMKEFSLSRDEKSIIPMVKKALKANPKLSLFASPWSPPAWMKKSGKMDGGGDNSRLRDEENIYKAYALYFEKYILGFKKLGIQIARLCPQNEMDLSPKYPGCLMEPAEIVNFITQNLAPQFKNSRITTEIWPGTFREKPKAPYAKECMKDEAFRKVITGLGIQYFNPKSIDSLVQIYPQLRLMHTEAICYNSKNDASQAQKRYSEILGIFNSGCDTFCYWNMLLDENQKSGWDWAQNSLLTINRATHETYMTALAHQR